MIVAVCDSPVRSDAVTVMRYCAPGTDCNGVNSYLNRPSRFAAVTYCSTWVDSGPSRNAIAIVTFVPGVVVPSIMNGVLRTCPFSGAVKINGSDGRRLATRFPSRA